MTKFKMVLLSVMGLVFFTVLPLVHAQDASSGEENATKGHSNQRIQEIFKQLNLTDEQKQQLDLIKHHHRARMEKAREEIRVNKENFRDEMMKPELNMPRIHEIHNHIKALQAQMEDDKLASILAVRSILTPDQFSKFISLMHKHKQEEEK